VRSAIWRRHIAIIPLVMFGAVLPLLISKTVFPDLSINLDEIAYLSQAEAIGRGELTRPASEFVPNFRPLLSGVHDDRVVFKFQPAWPAFMAASQALTGSYRPALAVTGAAAVLAMYAFSYELLRRRRVALLATIAFLGTPFVLVQSGTYLAYLPTVPLLLASSACLLRGLRTGRGWLLATGGSLFGLTFFHRGFDAVLWGLPLLAFLVRRGAPLGESLRRLGLAAAGAAPFGLLYLAYNTATMGSPTRPAFSSAGSHDTFGFGPRASYDVPGRPVGGLDFTLPGALRSARAAGAALPDWSFGWYLGIALAVVGVVVHRREATTWLLLALGAAFPAGYLFWWGTMNATDFGLHRVLGPFYWLPLCAPLAVLTALGIETVVARTSERAPRVVPLVAAAALVVMAVVPMWRMWPEVNRSANARNAFVYDRMAPAGGRTLLLVNESGYDPYVPTVVPADLSEPERLTARVSASGRLDLMARMSDRRVFERRGQHQPEGLFEPTETVTVELRIEKTRRFVIPLHVIAANDADRVTAYLQVGEETHETDLGPMRTGDRRTVDLAVAADEAARTGPDDVVLPEAGSSSTIRAGVRLERGRPGVNTNSYELRWEARTTSSDRSPMVELVVPATPWHRYTFPDGSSTWTPERTDPVLEVA
jgi:hypothetical protein